MNTDITALVKDIQDRVREVAYLMWESAGRHHGMAMEYWLAAEREVISTMQSAAERMMPGQARAGGGAADATSVGGGEGATQPSGEPAKAMADPTSAPEPPAGKAEPVSQASEAVVEATPAIAEASEAAGSTARAAGAAAKPTRKAAARSKRTPTPGT